MTAPTIELPVQDVARFELVCEHGRRGDPNHTLELRPVPCTRRRMLATVLMPAAVFFALRPDCGPAPSAVVED